jgi:RNA 2',3'-cyclic 3'-phosphodiesterase
MHRLFVALRPPATIRDLLADSMDGVPDARWQDDAQLHLTLRYVGEVDRRVAEDAAEALSTIAAPAAEVAIAGVGRFEHKGRTEALWAGVAPHSALSALHRKVDRALVSAGLAPERRAYLPHVTLARLPRGAGAEVEVAAWLVRHAALASAPFTMGEMILYESRLGRAGASYTAVAEWPLILPA